MAFRRAWPTTATILTSVGLVTMAAETLGGMWLAGVLFMGGVIFALVHLAIGLLIATGIKWLPLVGVAVAVFALTVGSRNPIFIARLTHPEMGALFVLAIVQLAAGIVAIVAGLTASVQTFRRGRPRVASEG